MSKSKRYRFPDFLRGLLVVGCSVLISLVTDVFMPQNTIMFGVLSLLGSSMLIMIPLERVFKKVHPVIGTVVALVLFVLTRNVASGELPEMLYANLFTAYLGFPPRGFVSQDYFPLIPWLFLYITGYFICGIFKKYSLFGCADFIKCQPIEWIGKHSLVVYMVHQPVIYAILWLVYNRVS